MFTPAGADTRLSKSLKNTLFDCKMDIFYEIPAGTCPPVPAGMGILRSKQASASAREIPARYANPRVRIFPHPYLAGTGYPRVNPPTRAQAYARDTFNALKSAFTIAPVLRHFDPDLERPVHTDASDFAIAEIIQQPNLEGNWHPISYFSRRLTPPEINYDVHNKEMLAIIKTFRDGHQSTGYCHLQPLKP